MTSRLCFIDAVHNWREQARHPRPRQSPLPIFESQDSVLCAGWFTFQINLSEVVKDPAALLKE
jgi:hypothetical protein